MRLSLKIHTSWTAAALAPLNHTRYWAHFFLCYVQNVSFKALSSFVQGLAFLPKTQCNVRDVEIAVALMLTKSTIEPVAFRVPRVKVRQHRHSVGKWSISMQLSLSTSDSLSLITGLQKEFFQDDLYPDTDVCWEPALTASAWLSGSNGQHKKMSIKPKGMTPGTGTTMGMLMFLHVGWNHAVKSWLDSVCLQLILVSEAPKEAPVRKYLPSSVYLEEKTDEQKKEEVKILIHFSHVWCDVIAHWILSVLMRHSCSAPWWLNWGTWTTHYRRTRLRGSKRTNGWVCQSTVTATSVTITINH